METERILVTLRRHAPELQSAGVAHLRLFGSAARGEATTHSDIDLLADFTPNARISLLTISCLQIRLAELLGAEVDLSSPDWLKEPIREQALREAVYAF
jgi:predicted nucleotidyltransferase